MLVFCRTIMLNVFIKRFYVNLKEDFIREVRFLDVIKKDTVLFFDMDGTLVDTDYANFLAYQQAISEIVESDLNIEYDSNFRLNRSSLKIFVPFLSETEYCGIIEKKEELYNNYLHEIQVCKEKVSVIFEYAKYNKINKFQNAIEKLDITPNIVIAFENEESEILFALKAGIEIINPKMDGSYARI